MAGKGSRRRPTKVTQAVADENFEAIFGKYVPTYLRKQILEDNNLVENKKIKDNPNEQS